MGTWPIEMEGRTGGCFFEYTEVREVVGTVHCPLTAKKVIAVENE